MDATLVFGWISALLIGIGVLVAGSPCELSAKAP